MTYHAPPQMQPEDWEEDSPPPFGATPHLDTQQYGSSEDEEDEDTAAIEPVRVVRGEGGVDSAA